MNFIISFTLSVAAGVVSYYICKWLDDQFKAGKHYSLASRKPPRYSHYRGGFLLLLGEFYELQPISFTALLYAVSLKKSSRFCFAHAHRSSGYRPSWVFWAMAATTVGLSSR